MHTFFQNKVIQTIGITTFLLSLIILLNLCKKDIKTTKDNSTNDQSVRYNISADTCGYNISADTCYGLSSKGDSLRLIWSRSHDSVTVTTKVIHQGEEPRFGIYSRMYVYDLPFDTIRFSVTRPEKDTNKYFFIPLDSNLVCSPWYNLGGALASWEASCFCDEGNTGADCDLHTTWPEPGFYCTRMQGCGCCGTWVRRISKDKSEDILFGNYIFIRARVINYNGRIVK